MRTLIVLLVMSAVLQGVFAIRGAVMVADRLQAEREVTYGL